MSEIHNPGEEKAWDLLSSMSPEAVCRAAAVTFDASSESYSIRSFGMDFHVSLRNRTISSDAPGSRVLLQKLAYFFRLSVLWYLVHAKDIGCTERLVKLETMKGGDIFTKGSHVLPLDAVSRKYGNDRDAFLNKGMQLGGKSGSLGDASLKLHPLPRVPVVLILWLQNEEFPARADVLFDSTCQMQMPADIIWSVAMVSVLVMV
jgi:hypothetical protein